MKQNVKTLQITWIQWATLIASLATLFVIVAPRFNRPMPPAIKQVEVKDEQKPAPKQRPRGRHEQQPELVAP